MGRRNAIAGVGLSLVASAGLAAYVAGRRAVPPWTGSLRISGLQHPVEILRDRWGIPSINASTEADLFFAQGVVHASDRLFQMDLLRRAGTGRLAEIFGSRAVSTDRLIRTLGFHRHADADLDLASESSRAVLTAYTAGVNAWMAQLGSRRPVEFRMVRYRPEPWRAADCLLATRMMALSLCGNWQSELTRAEIAAQFGAETLAVLDADAHARPFAAQIATDVLGELISAVRDVTGTLGLGYGTGSNNWVIGPDRTATGGAILANDPHLDLTLPSVWFEQLLRCDTYEARGFSIPGTPGVVLGHNGRVAWGFTNSVVDVQDLYLEQLEGESYRDTDGSLQPLEAREERIVVQGEADVVFTVHSTRRGPLLTDAVPVAIEQPISIRWDAIQPGRMLDASLGMNRAQTVDQLRDALRMWGAPAQNVVFADIQGNIGYQHAGEIPVRAASNGTVPLAGTDPAGEWSGTVPWGEVPHALNPQAGRIVTANDRIVDDSYPHFISVEWMNGYRGQRIRELIDAQDGHTIVDQRRIQVDVHSLPGEQLQDVLQRLMPTPATPSGRDVLQHLLTWDAQLDADGDGPIAYRLFVRALQEEVFGFLGPLLASFLGYSRTGIGGFWSLFGRSLPRLLHDMRATDSTLLELGAQVVDTRPVSGWEPSATWSEVVSRALDRVGRLWDGTSSGDELHPRLALPGTRSFVASKLMRGPGQVRTSRIRHRYHRLRLQHPLGVIPGFATVSNHGPFAVAGDADTVWASAAFNNPLNDSSMVGPSHRHVIDLADLDNSQAVLCGGQSGHPASPHYVDQVRLWREGQLRPAPWTRGRIERDAVYRQLLVAADSPPRAER